MPPRRRRLRLFVNGRHMTTAILSPARFEDFITGYLYTEEIIRNVDEIESVRIEENRISVLTRNLFKRGQHKEDHPLRVRGGCLLHRHGETAYDQL